jgi:hypothetical protein
LGERGPGERAAELAFLAAKGKRMGMFIPYHAAEKNPGALATMRELWADGEWA